MKHRTLGMEQLESRTTLDATDAAFSSEDVSWDGLPLSDNHIQTILPGSTSGVNFSLDIASPDGSRIARGLQDGRVQIFDSASGAMLHQIDSPGPYVAEIALSPDGKYLAVGTGIPDVRIYDAGTFAELRRFPTRGFVYPLVFIGDEIFSSTWEDKPICVLNIRTGIERTIGGGNVLTTIGHRLYGYDHTGGILREIDPASGSVLRTLNLPGGSALVGSPSSNLLALGTSDGNVLLFDPDLRQLGAFQPAVGRIEHLGFDGSGLKLAARGQNTIVYVDLSAAKTGGMMEEDGRSTISAAGRYESSVPMSRDGSVVFLRTEQRIIAERTPWADAVDSVIEETEGDVFRAMNMPKELSTLISEAVAMADIDTLLRTPDQSEVQLLNLPKGLHLNLREALGTAIGVDVRARSSSAITAHVFSGDREVATISLGLDGVLHYQHDDGITDVIFEAVSRTPVTLANMKIASDHDLDFTSASLTPFTSRSYALTAAPIVPMPKDVSYVARKLGFTGSNSISGMSRRYIMRDPTKYTLIRTRMSQGSGKISMIGTIKKDGVDHMGREYGSTSGFPQGYAEWHGENVVVIAPGAPMPISLTAGLAGSKGSISVTYGDSPEALLPPKAMSKDTVAVDILTMFDQERTEGVRDGSPEIRQGESPVFSRPGDFANVLYQVRNEALGGGTIMMSVYVSWYTGEPTRGQLQKTFSIPLGGGASKDVSVNVRVPGKPADATSERPIICAVLKLPNGATVESTRLGKLPKNMDGVSVTYDSAGKRTIEWKSLAYTASEQARLQDLTRRAVDALMNRPELAVVRAQLGDARVSQLVAETAAEAMQNVDPDTVSATTKTEAMNVGNDTFTEKSADLIALAQAAEKPTSENTMVLAIYGSNQFPGDGSGFDNLVNQLLDEYKEFWFVSPGQNITDRPRGVFPATTMREIENFILNRLEKNPVIKNIVMVGYSWGGGAVYDLSEWIRDKKLKLNVLGTGYVDAVNFRNVIPENRMPINTKNMMNLYQSNLQGEFDAPVCGGPVPIPTNGMYFSQVDLDALENKYDHLNIDEAAVPYLVDFIHTIVPVFSTKAHA